MTDQAGGIRTYRQFIDGQWVESASGQTASVMNPARGEVIASVQSSGPEDVERAVAAAARAFQGWRESTPQDRSRMLLRLADALEARADELGRLESRNCGKPVAAAIDEVAAMVDNIRFFAGAARVLEGKAAKGATPWAWWSPSRPGTTPSTWPAGRSARRSRRATRSS